MEVDLPPGLLKDAHESTRGKDPENKPSAFLERTGIDGDHVTMFAAQIDEWFNAHRMSGVQSKVLLGAIIGRGIQLGYRIKEMEDEPAGDD